jgi:hypothetical protein
VVAKTRWVLDGDKILSGNKQEILLKDRQPDEHLKIKRVFAEMGLFYVLIYPARKAQPLREGPGLRDFEVVPVEKTEGAAVHRIRYSYGEGKKEADSVKFELWIDAETDLPVKRVMELPDGHKITEAYLKQPFGEEHEKLFGRPGE